MNLVHHLSFLVDRHPLQRRDLVFRTYGHQYVAGTIKKVILWDFRTQMPGSHLKTYPQPRRRQR